MSTVDQLISAATAELGKPYVFGDEGPLSFDCSGLMQWVYGRVGVRLPRTAAEQQRATTPVDRPLPGDLVFYGRPAHHVALYIGAGRMIAAPHAGARVQVQSVYATPTSYGRVAGLGTAAAPALGALTALGDGAGGLVADVLGGARHVVIEGLVVVAALALVGYGLWRLAQPAVSTVVREGKELL